MNRPEKSEYAPYFERYVGKVPDGDIRDFLFSQLTEFGGLIGTIGEERAAYRYAEGKWSVKQVVGHIVDTERIFGYRALAIARGDKTPLPSFDQDAYVEGGGFDARSMTDIAVEFTTLRQSMIRLFGSFDEKAWLQRGSAGDNEATVRAIAWIIVGHLIHHRGVLLERYL
jgi:uncharacterized damage-inducible protein DinB